MTLQTTVLLLAAIASEVVGTAALKLSEGFTQVIPSIVVVVGYGLSFYLLALILKQSVPIGLIYAIWAGLGTVGISAVGVLVWHDRLNFWSITGMILVITGVVILNLTGNAHA